MRRIFLAVVIVSLTLAVCGCTQNNPITGAATAAQWEREHKQLKALGTAYLALIKTRNQGPTGWHELPQSPEILALQQAGCVVQWGKNFRDAKNGTSCYALAYLPDAPEKGGAVLRMDGAVTRERAEEVQDLLAGRAR